MIHLMDRHRKKVRKRSHALLIVALILPGILLSLAFIQYGVAVRSSTATTTISTVSFSGMTWNVSGYANFANTAQQVWVDS